MSAFTVDGGGDTDFWMSNVAEQQGGSWRARDASPAAPGDWRSMLLGDATGLGSWGSGDMTPFNGGPPPAGRRSPTAGPSAEDRGDPREAALPEKKAEARNLSTRLVGREVVAGGARLTISAGFAQGVFAGMPGYLADDAGRSIADFTVDDPRDSFSFAFTTEHHQDTIKTASRAVVNPSSAPGPGGGGSKK